ncbi:MAG: 3-oxoacyl-[acyl-carrier-protein] synthase III C-terminal domain-containing protein [Thermodesulfovibrionales bacterium]
MKEYLSLPSELPLSATVAHACLLSYSAGASIDHLLYTSSLPRIKPHLGVFELSSKLDIAIGHVLDLGTSCTSILDSVYLSFLFNALPGDNSCLIVVADLFSHCVDDKSISQKDDVKGWASGAGAIILSQKGNIELSLLSYVTIYDFSLCGLVTFSVQQPNYALRFSGDHVVAFQQEDVAQELSAIKAALRQANLLINEIDGLVVINRQHIRTEQLAMALGYPKSKIFSSRNIYGHTGGADILINLRSALDIILRESQEAFIILSGNGLGYCWSAMVLQVKTCPNDTED